MASEEDVLLREVDEDLSRDQAFARFEKYKVPLAVGAATIVLGVTGWQLIGNQQQAARDAASSDYAGLSFRAEEPVAPEALADYALRNETGYAVLAALRAAGTLGAQGDLEGAASLYARVYEDKSLSPALRDFARIRAGYLLFDNRPEDAASIVSLIETDAFRPHAEEIQSGAAMAAGAYEAARAGFEALAANPDAAPGLRSRAASYAVVADAAANGASIAPPVSESDFIQNFGDRLRDAGAPVNDLELAPLNLPPDLLGTDTSDAEPGSADSSAAPSDGSSGEPSQEEDQ